MLPGAKSVPTPLDTLVEWERAGRKTGVWLRTISIWPDRPGPVTLNASGVP